MLNKLNQMFKKKWLVIFVSVLLLAVAGSGYYYYTTQAAAGAATSSSTSAMQTATAHQGDLTVMASGSGTVATTAMFGVGFDESGTLIELNVGIGDKVKKGDVLARLETQNTEEEIASSISAAELSVIQAETALKELKASAGVSKTEALNNIATYAQAVRDAQYTLENYSMPLSLQDMETVEAVDKTKAALDVAWAAFVPYEYYPRSNDTREDLLEELNERQADYDAAIKRLNYEYTLQVAQANLEKARQDYAEVENGPSADDLKEAEAQLASAQAKLALAKEKQHIVDLPAPISGTIMTVDAYVGATISEASILTLADLDSLYIEAYLDESDLDKAVVGNEVEVTFDALPNQTFIGQVITVSPGLETVDNVEAIKIIVALNESAAGTTLPVGLNATVDVISGRATDAVLVPVEALRQIDTDEYGVFVIENGQPVFRAVQVGLQDVTTVEIISGVEAGETVSTGIIQTQ